MHDGFATHIEAGIDEHRAARHTLKFGKQRVIARISFPVYGLDAGRIVDMGDRGNFRARNIEFVDAEK